MSSLKFSTAVCFLTACLLWAPAPAADMAECGFHIGWASAEFNGNMGPSESKKGLAFGLHAAEYIVDKLRYQFELNYVQKGVNSYLDVLQGGVTYSQVETAVEFDYVEFPLLLKFDLGSPSRFRPVLFGGPYIAWVVQKDVVPVIPVVSGDVTYDMELHNYPYEFQPAKSDWGFVVGLGLEHVAVGNLGVGAELRYTRGIKKIVDSPSGSQLSNSVLSLLLCVGL